MDSLGLIAGALFLLAGAITAIVATCGCKNQHLCGVGALIFVLWGIYTLAIAVHVITYSRLAVSIGQYAIAGWLVIYMGFIYQLTRRNH